MHFCGISQHYYHFFFFYFLSTWGVIFLITGNENALNLADMARAIAIQRGSSATVEELWTLDRLSTVALSQNYGAP